MASSTNDAQVLLTEDELAVVLVSIRLVLLEYEEWEYHTVVGAERVIAESLRDRLEREWDRLRGL